MLACLFIKMMKLLKTISFKEKNILERKYKTF